MTLALIIVGVWIVLVIGALTYVNWMQRNRCGRLDKMTKDIKVLQTHLDEVANLNGVKL